MSNQEELDEERWYYESRVNERDTYAYFQNVENIKDPLPVDQERMKVWLAILEFEKYLGAWSG